MDSSDRYVAEGYRWPLFYLKKPPKTFASSSVRVALTRALLPPGEWTNGKDATQHDIVLLGFIKVEMSQTFSILCSAEHGWITSLF